MIKLAFASRLAQIQQAGPIAKVGALAGGAAAVLVPDAFFWLFLILLGSNAFDWIFGRHAARARGEFSTVLSRQGLMGKGAQMSVLLVLRSLEAVLPLMSLPSTLGIGAGALCFALIAEDLSSMERHIVDLGGRRIPGLSFVLDRFRALSGADRRGPRESSPPDEGKDLRSAD